MLSICIPIYNRDVNVLVKELHRQCEEAGIPFQILCFDDKSEEHYRVANADLAMMFNVSYVELSENHGRAKIRNKMAKLARYDLLLFLDCDSRVAHTDYIKNYLEFGPKYPIVYGGRIYNHEDIGKDYMLHWVYGSKVESQSLKRRLQNPSLSFMSNNFTVWSKTILSNPFDESIQGYGYEDLEWAERLNQNGQSIMHIDNEVIHEGLDTNQHFIDKSLQAARNLRSLTQEGKITGSKLASFAIRAERLGVKKLLCSLVNIRKSLWVKQLAEGDVSLWKLQLLKLDAYWQNQ